jgi:aspartate racemase
MNPLEAAPGLIGVLGGMGPLATVDFMQKLIAATTRATNATRDQDHVPVVVSSIPQIPDRNAAFRGEGVSPLAAMISSGQRLIQAGAGLLVVPCNTAHLWFDELEAALPVPMMHMVDAALEDAASGMQAGARLGLLCTDATFGPLHQPRGSDPRVRGRAVDPAHRH